MPSTTSAESIATSVPAPMAIPTSARASAGASLTPSPTIATASRAPAARPLGVLVFGQHLGHDLVDTKFPSDRLGDLVRIPVIMMTCLPEAAELRDGLLCLRSNLVLERERADDVAVIARSTGWTAPRSCHSSTLRQMR